MVLQFQLKMLATIVIVNALCTLPVMSNIVFSATKDSCRDQFMKCMMTRKGHTPVCSTDKVSHSSYCDVDFRRCTGEFIGVNYVGKCIDKTPCFTFRQNSLSNVTCRPDGTFTPIQCNPGSGECWCVTQSGEMIPNTLVYQRKPACPTTDPRALTAHLLEQSQPSVHHGRCSPKRFLYFAKNLLTVFETDYNRTIDSSNATTPHSIASWKFSLLDTDHSGQLNRQEVKLLIKLAEKTVKPKKCARSLPTFCDMSRDESISLSEWRDCLLRNTTDFLKRPAKGILLIDEEPVKVGANDGDNCTMKRTFALDYQKRTSQSSLYVPECREDGLYEPLQCYSGYCWCVNPATGTSVHRVAMDGEKPTCGEGLPVKRFMKGCAQGKQEDLIDDMMQVMKTKFKAAEANETLEDTKEFEEKAARWTFLSLDLNRNQVLQRGQEWRNVRQLLPGNRCAKKFPKFCDVSGDERISLQEWLDCLNVFWGIRHVLDKEGINPMVFLHGE